MADTDPDALEREIERTRAELARTVDAIADRVSPKRVAERGVAKVKANAEHLVSSIGDLVGGPTTRSDTEMEGEGRYAPAQSMAPVLIGIGAVLVVGAAIILMRRRTR
ncbi:DUF3618 domain-containing protein [Planotetraspora kaengkrachanensis]|uniref:DUF3618 domain-containing protein n=1 Tax=Planotetraspora kaengkrachanensis TaxID=575193 RepID=A0A8J3V7Q6_9ACTN|nr:DUF3618 domain-containing protein [Planotetraspora kaengkrachanensis]GIG81792.1 hypothetical protein Pka01_49190 [Planotetraspora kaengkrachanensis]